MDTSGSSDRASAEAVQRAAGEEGARITQLGALTEAALMLDIDGDDPLSDELIEVWSAAMDASVKCMHPRLSGFSEWCGRTQAACRVLIARLPELHRRVTETQRYLPDGEREQFEAWARSEGYGDADLARLVDAEGAVYGGYTSAETVALFVGWCARARWPAEVTDEQLAAAAKAYDAVAVPAWSSNRHWPALAAAIRAVIVKTPLAQFVQLPDDQRTVVGARVATAAIAEQRKTMIEPLKITKSVRELMEKIQRQDGKLLELQLAASGGRSYTLLNKLRKAGFAELCDHPTVKERGSDYPARAVRLTDAGRAALGAAQPPSTASGL